MKNSTLNWWYCDNIVHTTHKDQIGLLHMGEPRVFILVRNYGDIYPGDFHDFVRNVEVSCFSQEDKLLYNREQSKVLRNAYNFLALQEAEEDRIATDFLDEDLEI